MIFDIEEEIKGAIRRIGRPLLLNELRIFALGQLPAIYDESKCAVVYQHEDQLIPTIERMVKEGKLCRFGRHPHLPTIAIEYAYHLPPEDEPRS